MDRIVNDAETDLLLGTIMLVRNVAAVRGTSMYVEVTAELGDETITYHCPNDNEVPKIHDRITVFVGANHGRQR